jgi:hypothetical protein
MATFHEAWRDHAAVTIQESYGTEKALGYLIGEKLLHHLAAAETRPEFARMLPAFVAEIRELFEPHVLREYLDSMFHDDVVSAR